MARKEASILPFMVLRLDQDQMFQSVVVILLREEAEIGNHCISGFDNVCCFDVSLSKQ